MGQRGCCVNPTVDAYNSSSIAVKNCIRTYGHSAFRKKILGVFVTEELVGQAEVTYHASLDVRNNCYFFNQANQTSSAFLYSPIGITQTPESNAARSAALRGRPQNHSPEG